MIDNPEQKFNKSLTPSGIAPAKPGHPLRDGLDIKTKQMLTVTILATLGNAKPQLAYHINGALNLGIKRSEIIDIMTHISGYAGFPAALNGIATAKEVFADRDEKNIEN